MIMSSYSLFQGNELARAASWFIGILGILGNIFILIYINKVKFVILPSKVNPSVPTNKAYTQKSSKVTDFLICNLAIADLLGCTYLIIIAAADVYYGYQYPSIYQVPLPRNQINIWALNPFCFIAKYAYYTSSVASITITLLIAVDRFIVVLFPYSSFRLNLIKCKILITIVWFLLCCYGAIPIVIGLHGVVRSAQIFRFNINLCLNFASKQFLYYLISRQVIYYTFCIIIMLCYCIIIAYLKHKKTRISSRMNVIERRIFIMMLLITASNVFSLLPSTILFSSKTSLFHQSFNISQVNGSQNCLGTARWHRWPGSTGRPRIPATNRPSQPSLISKISQHRVSLSPTKNIPVRISSRTNYMDNRRNNFWSLHGQPRAYFFNDLTRALVVSLILTFINALTNPIIYFYFSWSAKHRKWHWFKSKKHTRAAMNAIILTKTITESGNGSMQSCETNTK